jgi:hypothetical protein
MRTIEMRAETKAILERVVDKAAKLRKSAFLRDLEERGWKITFHQREIIVTRPPDEARDAFILTLRFFITQNEATSFRRLAKLLDDPDLTDEWKHRFEFLRSSVNQHLAAAYGEHHYAGRSHRFSQLDILNTFLYGGLVHANKPEAVTRFNEWCQSPGQLAMFEMWFIKAIRALSLAIFLLSDICEDELKRAGGAGESMIVPSDVV